MSTRFTAVLSAMALCLPVAAFGQAADEHAGHHPPGQAAAPQSAGAAPDAGDTQAGMAALDQGVKRLQELMTQIKQTGDAVERENLLHEHMIALLEQMKLIRKQSSDMKMAMMGGGMGMMGDDKKPEGAASKPDKDGSTMGGRMMGSSMMKMHKMMDRRVEMLELMLEQAIEHSHAREAANP